MEKSYDETIEAEYWFYESTTKDSIQKATEVTFENDVTVDELVSCLTFYNRDDKEK